MPMSEFIAWRLLEDIEPFGQKREDLRAAILWATLRNIFRGEKDTNQYQVIDYPLMDHMQEEMSKAESLHQQFLMFKTQYDIHRAEHPALQ